MLQIQTIYEEMKSIEGFQHVFFFDEEGDPLWLPENQDKADTHSALAIGVGAVQSMSQTLWKHPMQRFVVESKEGTLLIAPVQQQIYIAILATKRVSLGMLFAQCTAWCEQLQSEELRISGEQA